MLKYMTAVLADKQNNFLFPNVKFIFLVGETRVGKDTIAAKIKDEYTSKRFQTQILPLADELKRLYKEKYNKDPDKEKEKEDEQAVLRQQLYDLSLEIKKTEGKSFFCRESVFKKIKETTNIVIVPDLRFLEEYEYFKNNLKNITIIKIKKKDKEVNETFLNIYETEKIPFDDVIETVF